MNNKRRKKPGTLFTVVLAFALSLVVTFQPVTTSLAANNERLNAGTTIEKADQLKAAGLFTGSAAGYDLAGGLTRIQGLVLALRTQGMEAAVLKQSSEEIQSVMKNVSDADAIPGWAKAYVAYSLKQVPPITSGVSSQNGRISFGPAQQMSGAQFVVFLQRAMGYPVAMEGVAAIAASTNMLTESQRTKYLAVKAMTRADAVEIMHATVVNGIPKAWTKSVIDKLVTEGKVAPGAAILLGYVAPVPETVTRLLVKDIVALSPKQILVTFNQELMPSAAVASNFSVKEAGSLERPVVAGLQADHKAVVLTLEADTAFVNGSTVDVTVSRAVKDASGLPMVSDFIQTGVSVLDRKPPVLLSVEPYGRQTIRLRFDEPVWGGTGTSIPLADFKVKMGSTVLRCQSALARYDSCDVLLQLTAEMFPVPITVSVNADASQTGYVRDFSGAGLPAQEITFQYAPDTTGTTATFESVDASGKTVNVRFSKPVHGINVRLFLADNASVETASSFVTKSANLASEVWQFTMPSVVPSIPTNYRVTSSQQDGYQLSDLYGNPIPDLIVVGGKPVDSQPPKIISVDNFGNDGFDLLFDATVSIIDAENAARYEIRNASGTLVPVKNSLLLSDQQTVRLYAGLIEKQTYSVQVSQIHDLAGNVLASWSGKAMAADSLNPSVVKAYASPAVRQVYLTFSEPMNMDGLREKTNYWVDRNGGMDGFQVLGAEDSITVLDDKHVRITLGNSITLPSVKLMNLRDVSGKKLGSDTITEYMGDGSSLLNIGPESVTLIKAELVERNLARLTFDTRMSVLDPASILIRRTANGELFETPVTVDSVLSLSLSASGNSEALVRLNRKLNPDATVDDRLQGERLEVQTLAAGSHTDAGAPLGSRTHPTALPLLDAVGGGISTNPDGSRLITWNDFNTDGKLDTISIRFEEAVESRSVEKGTFTVQGYEVLNASTDSNGIVMAGEPGDKTTGAACIILNINRAGQTADAGSRPTVVQQLPVRDLAGNAMK